MKHTTYNTCIKQGLVPPLLKNLATVIDYQFHNNDNDSKKMDYNDSKNLKIIKLNGS